MRLSDRVFIIVLVVIAFIWLSYAGRTAIAQQPSTLSLEEHRAEIEKSQGSARTELHLQYIKRIDISPKERATVAERVFEENKALNSPRINALALNAKGLGLGQQGEFGKAIETLIEAEKAALQWDENGPEVFVKARSNRALFLVTTGNRTESVGLLLELIEYAKPFGDRLSVGHAYLTLGNLAENSGSIAKAFEYLQKAFEVATKANNLFDAGATGETIVALLLEEGQYEAAADWCEKAQPWVDASKSPAVIFSFKMRREELQVAIGDINAALVNLRELVRSATPNIEPQMVGNVYLAIAKAEFKRRQNEAAIEAAEEALKRLKNYPRTRFLVERVKLDARIERGDGAELIPVIERLLEDCKDFVLPSIKIRHALSRVYARLGRFEEALEEQRKAESLETKRLKERSQEQVNFMTAVFEDRQRENQLALLKQQQIAMETNTKLIEAEAQQQSIQARYATQIRNIVLWLSVVGVVASTLFVIAYFKLRETRLIATRVKELNDEISQKFDRQAVALRSEEETRRKLELTLERKQRDEALGKLTGGVAHDFNNLLTVILNSNQILLMKEEGLTNVGQELLSASNTAAQTGASIIKQLMSYAGQQSLATEPIRVSDWLLSVRGLLQQALGESISFVERDNSDGAVIATDTAKLTTAIINLLSNAKDAISSNGSVELVISRIYLDSTDQNSWKDDMLGNYVLFEVVDNGTGIPPDLVPKVCNPFFTTKQLKSGTGLGLSSVLGFVRQSRGEFRIESELGKGTSAKFILPLCELNAKNIMPDEQADKPVRNKTILVVEDQDAVRSATVFMLRMLGYTVYEANGAEAAIQFLQGDKVTEIVLTDVQMPGIMDGMGLRTWLRANYPNVRVILTSGYMENRSDIGKDFLQKPYSLKAIEEMIERKESSSPC